MMTLEALLFAPLLLSITNRTKAFFAGRRGPPLLQIYFDLWKLLRKGAIYSQTTTWILKVTPLLVFVSLLIILFILPFGHIPAVIAFSGDFLILIYFLALARFFLVLSALDTGSSFEGMGASREVFFSALSEVAFILALGALAWETGSLSLSQMLTSLNASFWQQNASVLVLVGCSLFLVFLAENSRIPFDDPNTHLELTMRHEVMILDYSGPDLALLQYSSALKHWILASLLVGVLTPLHFKSTLAESACLGVALVLLAVFVGAVESSMARIRLLHIPKLLVGAIALSLFAMLFGLRG